ncbi:methylmalonyl-CoA mutase family protein [Astrobacterium formosum]|uniref:methylmalonyl-CoA mutase family protein n=1 Tax=Astrobacterium formosum TaxID=3069710 RepID=UPI003F4FF51A
MTETQELTLAKEFPAPTREQWLKLVDGVLKGVPFEKKLISKTYDGLTIEPLYAHDSKAKPVASRPPGAPWQIAQRVDHPDPAVANAEALHDLENGATALTLVFAGSVGAYGYGLPATEAALDRALAGVDPTAIAIELDIGPYSKDTPAHLAALLKKRGVAASAANVRFGFDPIGAAAISGQSPLAWSELAPLVAPVVKALSSQGFKGPFLAADGRVVHNAGGSEAQELAYTLAVGVAYLRALETGGIDLDTARKDLFFRLTADVDQFLTIAKFRALRKLWARIEDACGLKAQPIFISAETAWRMMTKRDPWVNGLRSTVAAFSAGVGGANSLTVLPLSLPLGLPNRLARRIARNTQLLLLEEAHIAKVADPTAGSGGIEELTSKLVAAAWALFQEIEKTGGAFAALASGLLQGKVMAVRSAREANIGKRKDALTGTSEFPNIHEAPVPVLDVKPVALPAFAAAKVSFAALEPMRLGSAFEALRDASDRALAKTGSRPKIFLANLGPIAAFTARAMYAKNFFEAGGIEALGNDGFPSQDDMVAAFKASGAKLVILCSSDELYAAEAVKAAEAMKAAGAAYIYLAGRPGELEAAVKAAGVQGFIFMGCDVLKILQAAHATLGLK